MKKLFDFFIIPLAGVLLLLSVLTLTLSSPLIWQPLYKHTMQKPLEKNYPSHSAIALQDAKKINAAFWQDTTYEEVNKQLTLRKIQPKEIEHFEDVKKKVHQGFYVILITVILLFIWSIVLNNKIRWSISLLQVIIVGGGLAIWGTLAWRNMFRTLHDWFFQDDSWKLPKDSYTLKLYPYAIWQNASIVLLSSLILFLILLSLYNLKKPQAHKISV